MSDHELLRFTAKKLSAKQVAHIMALVGDWHGVHVDVVGDGQVGIVGPDQRHDILIQGGDKANGQYL
jgi:hypothetical protein